MIKTEGLTAWLAERGLSPSAAPIDVPSVSPLQSYESTSVPTRTPRKNITPLPSSVPSVVQYQDQGVMQTCAGTAQLDDGVPYALSPIGPGESETFCFEPTMTTDGNVYCYTLCMDDRVCNSDFNKYIASDAMLGLATYGQGAVNDTLCGSQNYYTNDEYCSVPLQASTMPSGVQVTVTNTLRNSKAVDWAGPMDSVFVSCSTSLPPCRGSFLTAQNVTDNATDSGKRSYRSDKFLLPAYKVDPNEHPALPPMYADFCLDDVEDGAKIVCRAECASSSCSGKATIYLERNFPSDGFECRGINEPCSVVVDGSMERLIVRVRSMKDSGPLIDYSVSCTVVPPASYANRSNATSKQAKEQSS